MPENHSTAAMIGQFAKELESAGVDYELAHTLVLEYGHVLIHDGVSGVCLGKPRTVAVRVKVDTKPFADALRRAANSVEGTDR